MKFDMAHFVPGNSRANANIETLNIFNNMPAKLRAIKSRHKAGETSFPRN